MTCSKPKKVTKATQAKKRKAATKRRRNQGGVVTLL
jgi:hypothetical protein